MTAKPRPLPPGLDTARQATPATPKQPAATKAKATATRPALLNANRQDQIKETP